VSWPSFDLQGELKRTRVAGFVIMKKYFDAFRRAEQETKVANKR
jgi:hypothetical protein